MINVLFLCPIGVKNAQDAATATHIKNGSAFTPRLSAMSIAIGAAITAVAVLFMTSDSVIVTIIRTVSTTIADEPAVGKE